jgi:hypothetical protein
MFDSLTVCSWVAIREGCAMESEIMGSGATRFTFGKGQDGFEIEFDAEGLRAFLHLGNQVLDEMDTRFATEEAEHQSTEPALAANRP